MLKPLCRTKCNLNQLCTPICRPYRSQEFKRDILSTISRLHPDLELDPSMLETDPDLLKGILEEDTAMRCERDHLPIPTCVRFKDLDGLKPSQRPSQDWFIRAVNQHLEKLGLKSRAQPGAPIRRMSRYLRHIQHPEDYKQTVSSPCAYMNIFKNFLSSCYVDSIIMALLAVPNRFLDQQISTAKSRIISRTGRQARAISEWEKVRSELRQIQDSPAPVDSKLGWFRPMVRRSEGFRQCTETKEGPFGDPAEYLITLFETMGVEPWLQVDQKMVRSDMKVSEYIFRMPFPNPQQTKTIIDRQGHVDVQSALDAAEDQILSTDFVIILIPRRVTEFKGGEVVLSVKTTPLYVNDEIQIKNQVLRLTGIVNYEPGHYTAYFPCGGWWWYYDDQSPFLLERFNFHEVQDDVIDTATLLMYTNPKYLGKPQEEELPEDLLRQLSQLGFDVQ